MSMQVIEHIEVGSGGAASITFSSIPQTYTDLYVVVSARDTDLSGAIVYLLPNGLTTNLSMRQLLGSGSAASSVSGTQIYARSDSSDRTANTFGSASFYISNYASSNYKSISIDGVEENNATNAYMAIQAGLWSSTDSITSLELKPYGTKNFVQYSSATLYGITAGSDGTTTVS